MALLTWYDTLILTFFCKNNLILSPSSIFVLTMRRFFYFSFIRDIVDFLLLTCDLRVN